MLSISSKFSLKPTSTRTKNSMFKPQAPWLTRQLNFSSSLPAVDPLFHQELAVVNSDFDFSPTQKQKLGVAVKPNGKPRVVLKFIWMQGDIGIALDQMIPGHGTIPLSPYYFWPHKDAWEELKVLLETKPWISKIERINLLNQATNIINLWQTSAVCREVFCC